MQIYKKVSQNFTISSLARKFKLLMRNSICNAYKAHIKGKHPVVPVLHFPYCCQKSAHENCTKKALPSSFLKILSENLSIFVILQMAETPLNPKCQNLDQNAQNVKTY